MIVSPGLAVSQMSPISPQPLLLSPQAAGAAYSGCTSSPMSVSVVASASSCDAVSVEFSSAVALNPHPVEQPPVNSSIIAP